MEADLLPENEDGSDVNAPKPGRAADVAGPLSAVAERCRLLAVDLDGTLLRRDGSLSERTVAALRSAALCLPVVIVTARPPRLVNGLAARLPAHSVAICSNGALVYDLAERELLKEHNISPAAAAEAVTVLERRFEGLAVAVERGLRYGKEPRYRSPFSLPPDAIVSERAELLSQPMAKLMARHSSPFDTWESLSLARELLSGLVEVTSSGETAPIEMTAMGVSKATALAELAAELGVPPEQVVAAGDMPNDLPMLAWAGWSAAPSSAHPEVREMADFVTGDCDDDGIAEMLEGMFG